MSPTPNAAASATEAPWKRDFVLLAAIWGASFLFMRVAAVEFGALPTAGVRVAVASVFLLPLLLARQHGRLLRQHWRQMLVIGTLNSGVPFVCFSFAALSISSGLSSILNATTPLMGAVIAWLWLRDRPNGSRILGLVIGFVGVALLASDKARFQPDAAGTSSGWAVLACLLATLCYGVSASYTKRHLAHLPALVSATGSQLGASLLLLPLTAWYWPAGPVSVNAWLSVVALGVLCSGVAYLLYFRIIERAGPTRALSVTFAIPVFAVLYGVVLLGETVTLWMLLCGAVIVAGTALSTGLVRVPAKRHSRL